jgi:hypothetical protein
MIIMLLQDVMQNRNRGRLDVYRQSFDKFSYRRRITNILFFMCLVRVSQAKTLEKCRNTLQNIRQRAANTGKQDFILPYKQLIVSYLIDIKCHNIYGMLFAI